MSRKYLKTTVFISIGAFSLFSWVLLTRTQTTADPTPEENRARTTQSQTAYRLSQNSQDTLTNFQKSDFYRTIIDNNLFRPLGWRTPRKKEPYRLLGTILPTDEESNSQAILQKTPAGRTYIVMIGEMLDTDTTVVDIQPKQMTLENAGVQRTLKLNTTPWIK
jgi:hypothetical protein